MWDKKVIDSFICDIKKTWLFPGLNVDIGILRDHLYKFEGKLDYLTICKSVILHTPLIYQKNAILLAGDKNPSYSVLFKKLYSLFGNKCKYIYLVRDYRDQFVSLKNAGIEIPDISVSTKRWVDSYNTIYSISQGNKENFHFLKYEDLVMQPEHELMKICLFLGIVFDPGMLYFNCQNEDLRKVYSEHDLNGVHKSILNPVNADKIGIWKEQLSKSQVGIADNIARKCAITLGYSESGTEQRLHYFILSLPGIILYYIAIFSEKLLAIAPFKLYLKYSGGAFFGSLWNSCIRKLKTT